jgi:hypothetical protein
MPIENNKNFLTLINNKNEIIGKLIIMNNNIEEKITNKAKSSNKKNNFQNNKNYKNMNNFQENRNMSDPNITPLPNPLNNIKAEEQKLSDNNINNSLYKKQSKSQEKMQVKMRKEFNEEYYINKLNEMKNKLEKSNIQLNNLNNEKEKYKKENNEIRLKLL